jgi:hypothetical protein
MYVCNEEMRKRKRSQKKILRKKQILKHLLLLTFYDISKHRSGLVLVACFLMECTREINLKTINLSQRKERKI